MLHSGIEHTHAVAHVELKHVDRVLRLNSRRRIDVECLSNLFARERPSSRTPLRISVVNLRPSARTMSSPDTQAQAQANGVLGRTKAKSLDVIIATGILAPSLSSAAASSSLTLEDAGGTSSLARVPS